MPIHRGKARSRAGQQSPLNKAKRSLRRGGSHSPSSTQSGTASSAPSVQLAPAIRSTEEEHSAVPTLALKGPMPAKRVAAVPTESAFPIVDDLDLNKIVAAMRPAVERLIRQSGEKDLSNFAFAGPNKGKAAEVAAAHIRFSSQQVAVRVFEIAGRLGCYASDEKKYVEAATWDAIVAYCEQVLLDAPAQTIADAAARAGWLKMLMAPAQEGNLEDAAIHRLADDLEALSRGQRVRAVDVELLTARNDLARSDQEYLSANSDAKMDALYPAVAKHAQRMIFMPSRSTAGIIAKLQAIAWCHSFPVDPAGADDDAEETTDTRILSSILRDLNTLGMLSTGIETPPASVPAFAKKTGVSPESLWPLHNPLAAEVDAYGHDVHSPAEEAQIARKKAGIVDKTADASFLRIEKKWQRYVDRFWKLDVAIMEAEPESAASIGIWLAVMDRWEGDPDMSRYFIDAVRRYAKLQ